MCKNFPRLFVLHVMEESSKLTFLWKALYMVQKKSNALTGHVTLHADVHVLSSMPSSESDMPPSWSYHTGWTLCFWVWLNLKCHLIKLGLLWRLFNHITSHLRFSNTHKHVPYQLGIILLVSMGLLIRSKLEGTLLNEDLCNEHGMRKMQLLFLLIP